MARPTSITLLLMVIIIRKQAGVEATFDFEGKGKKGGGYDDGGYGGGYGGGGYGYDDHGGGYGHDDGYGGGYGHDDGYGKGGGKGTGTFEYFIDDNVHNTYFTSYMTHIAKWFGLGTQKRAHHGVLTYL